MEQVNYKKKKQQNKQLLIIFKKLEQLEESCWSKLFRFQKSQTFRKFEQNYSVPSIISLRLDDFIYLFLLIIELLIFGLLPIDSSSYFTKPYRQSLALFFITSFIVMISPHWFRWLSLLLFCIGYPIMLFVSFNGYFTLMPVDTSEQFINYMGYLTLIPIFVFLFLIYPIKQYIRNHAGSLYSYIYGLALTLIIYLWPLYSFIQASGSFSFAFITSNKPLIISFISIMVIGFYFFIHHSLFELKFDKIKENLLADFSQGQLTQALQQSEEQYNENPSFFVDNFNVFIRFISFIFFAITLGCQIYLYLVIASDSSKITYVGPIMGYIMAFLLLGAFFIYLPLSKQVFIPFLAIISLSSAVISLAYYTSSTVSLQYFIISLSFPFFAVYWSLIKVINIKKPILRTKLIIILYIVLYLPVIGLVLNIYLVFSQDSSIVSILQNLFYSLIGLSLLCMLIVFIAKEISQKKEEKKQQQRQKIGVDYNYSQQGNPPYQHYQITSNVSVSSFSNVDIRDTGYLACMLFFLISQLMTIHAVNQLNTTFSSTVFYSSSIKEIIYSQFYIVLIFYIYAHVYMASQAESNKYIFGIYFFITAVLFFIISIFSSSAGSTALKFIGGFSLAMILVVLGLQAIKSYMIGSFGFISSIIVIAVWLFIVFPYVVMIPFISIYVDQTRFGVFVYGCILATVVLLVLMVGILTLIFNKLIDKYQQQKRYKFMIQDVSTLLQQQGIDAQDSQLHILYESYLYRDKKYVFFLKRGYPLNLLKDPDDQISKLVTSEDYSMKRIPTKKQMAEQKLRETSCIWACLTCCCGQDEEQIVQKIKKARKQMDKQQLKSLLPKSLAKGLIQSQNVIVLKKKKKNIINTTKVFSSKSLLLKSLHTGPRYLGDEYILLKTNKHTDLAIQIWHSIFYFAANKDEGEALLIANDFELLMNASGVDFTKAEYNQIFELYASKKWNQYSGMDLQNFSLAIQHICEKLYDNGSQNYPPQDRKYYFLINTVYFNLLGYEQFTNYTFQKKKIEKNSTKRSPFTQSYKLYRQFLANNKYKQLQMIEKINNYNKNKLAEPEQIQVDRIFEKQQSQKQKSISCKKSLFQKVKACQQCCKKQETRDQIQKKLFVKPWNLLSVDVVKILQRKQNQWSSSNDTKQHPFRITSNNILMAVFKILDLYTYISISIMNSHIPWFQSSGTSSSNLYLSYTTQTYLAAGVVAISVPLSIRGIMFIFQDRLGLTENRLPASFPHPMFFFTFIYKLLILSLFNIITQTFLDGFNCNWTDSSTTQYYLTDETSIECLSDSHSKFLLIGLIGIILYYPLSSYAMPNFQFAEKSLDLKYRSNYLILYFQVNFAMLAGKVLLNSSNNGTIQVIYNSINISGLMILAISVFTLQPCLITWFNYVQLIVVGIGLIVNAVGLVLYLTNQWLLCLIIVIAGCGLFVIITIIAIKRRYFSKLVYEAQVVDENIQELEMMWQYKQVKGKKIIEYEEKSKNKANFGLIANDIQDSAQDSLQGKTRS